MRIRRKRKWRECKNLVTFRRSPYAGRARVFAAVRESCRGLVALTYRLPDATAAIARHASCAKVCRVERIATQRQRQNVVNDVRDTSAFWAAYLTGEPVSGEDRRTYLCFPDV